MLNLPLALAIIGGEPARFAPFLDLYRQAARRAGHDPERLKTSINVHGFVAKTTQDADDTFYAPQAEVKPDSTGARLAADEPCAFRRRGGSARCPLCR
jgi:alkanesulfonate monooxygenase SsuD/methylene tetrahydromethanopterin reductase-like flavin-dependent oxidoreductase (luciferase family)